MATGMIALFRHALVATVLSTAVVLPSMATSAGAAATPQQATQPQSVLTGTACNGRTCQVVSGSGTKVTSWYTQTTAASAICTYARYFENGIVIAESGETCLRAGEATSATWNNPGRFAAGAVLCTAWSRITGKPCDRVE